MNRENPQWKTEMIFGFQSSDSLLAIASKNQSDCASGFRHVFINFFRAFKSAIWQVWKWHFFVRNDCNTWNSSNYHPLLWTSQRNRPMELGVFSLSREDNSLAMRTLSRFTPWIIPMSFSRDMNSTKNFWYLNWARFCYPNSIEIYFQVGLWNHVSWMIENFHAS